MPFLTFVRFPYSIGHHLVLSWCNSACMCTLGERHIQTDVLRCLFSFLHAFVPWVFCVLDFICIKTIILQSGHSRNFSSKEKWNGKKNENWNVRGHVSLSRFDGRSVLCVSVVRCALWWIRDGISNEPSCYRALTLHMFGLSFPVLFAINGLWFWNHPPFSVIAHWKSKYNTLS